MKVSVAMATYNGEKYIKEQLQSILRQTRVVDEVIITDDRSTDRTVELIRTFIAENHLQNWTCIVNDENVGFAENFRKAIDLLSGDLIIPCDQDDIWVEDRIEKMAAMMEAHPEIGLLNTAYITFQDGEAIPDSPQPDGSIEPVRIPLNMYTRFLRSLGCVMCLRMHFYQEIKKYWDLNWAHDVFFWCLSLLYDVGYQSAYCSLKRRLHVEQFSEQNLHTRQNRIVFLEGILQNNRSLLKIARQLNLSMDHQKMFEKSIQTCELRLKLLREKSLISALRLVPYLRYYRAKRSYLVELVLALKGSL